jgi:indole-3-glycerol phosphate synthase
VILDEILANKRQEVAERRARRPLSPPASARSAQPHIAGPNTERPGAVRSEQMSAGSRFVSALCQPSVSLIAEIKRKSPSGGALRPDLSPADLAQMYLTAGAAALSVLTDERYFGGCDADLTAAQQASGLPALRKDFVIDPYQILEAGALGAEAVLLIVRALPQTRLCELLELTHQCGMEALVETHSAEEVERALTAGARVIGVNNRDLDTLTTDVTLAPRLRPLVPSECIFVAESGISQPEDIAVLLDAGVDAVLVGESLLRAPDPGAKLRSLVVAGAAEGARRRGR